MALIVVEFVTMFEPEQNTIYPKEKASVNIKQQFIIRTKQTIIKHLILSNEDNYIICADAERR